MRIVCRRGMYIKRQVIPKNITCLEYNEGKQRMLLELLGARLYSLESEDFNSK